VDRDASEERSGSIRSVERAIDLLQALNRRPLSTLHDLHRETGLPKPSLVRLLRTLEAKGLAARSTSYGTYRLLGRVKSLSSGLHREPLIVEAAEDIMVTATERGGWPLCLALFDLDAMVVRVCTLPYTALSRGHSALNTRLSLVSRALGRAYLAYCAPHEQKALLEMLRHSKDPEDAAARDEGAMARMIAEVRERGYATRDPRFDAWCASIAVPVREEGRTIAALGLTWTAAEMTLQQATRQHLPDLLATAEAISAELARRSPQRIPA